MPDLRETINDATRLHAGDQVELDFIDDPPWLQLDILRADAPEFAAELLADIQGRTIDLSPDDTFEAVLVATDAYGWYTGEDNETVGATVRGYIRDLRPKSTIGEYQEAGIGSGLKLIAALAVATFALWAIHPVLTEARRTVRGFTEEEKPGQEPALPPVPLSTLATLGIVAGAAVALVYLTRRRS